MHLPEEVASILPKVRHAIPRKIMATHDGFWAHVGFRLGLASIGAALQPRLERSLHCRTLQPAVHLTTLMWLLN